MGHVQIYFLPIQAQNITRSVEAKFEKAHPNSGCIETETSLTWSQRLCSPLPVPVTLTTSPVDPPPLKMLFHTLSSAYSLKASLLMNNQLARLLLLPLAFWVGFGSAARPPSTVCM